MKKHYITKKLLDVFLDPEKRHTTGYAPDLWLRLQKQKNQWVQIAGVKVPSWKFKQILGDIHE